MMVAYSKINRLIWRISRRIYMRARGEQRHGEINSNGERALIERVATFTARDDVFVALDIGANQGEYSTAILTALGTGRHDPSRTHIHAFEPVPSTGVMFDTLLATVPGRECVSLHSCALSDQSGSAEIAVYAEGAGTNTLHFMREGRNDRLLVEVPLITMFEFVESSGIQHIHLVKIDTEGNDVAVLRGAKPLLQAGVIDVVQFEYNHRWVFGRAYLKDVFELIEGTAYVLARVDEDCLTVFEAWHPELERFFQSNYALIHTRAQCWFELHRGRFDTSNTFSGCC
jgi:FkbM family methyltransferase